MLELALLPFLEAAIRTATPLAFAALGELVSERAGVINLGLEGTIIAGCLGAAVGAMLGGSVVGFLAAAGAGLLIAAVFAVFVVRLGTDQIITGTALTMLGLGITGSVYHLWPTLAGVGTTMATTGPVALPLLSRLPVVGGVLFTQAVPTYVLYLLVPTLAWWLHRTHAGLGLRAVGEHPAAARAAGISPDRVRFAAICFSGAMGGLCGGTLVLAQVGSFNEGMSAGRGFIAIAIVVLGRWTPWGTAGAAVVFGGAFAFQYLAQSLGLGWPYQIFLAAPYLLTLLLLAAQRGRRAAPAHLGR